MSVEGDKNCRLRCQETGNWTEPVIDTVTAKTAVTASESLWLEDHKIFHRNGRQELAGTGEMDRAGAGDIVKTASTLEPVIKRQAPV